MSGWDWINIGTRPSHYPSDARAIVRWVEPLRTRVAEHPQPLLERIDPIKLFELAQKL